eukprot:TRINITY_DN10123_c0_g1_i1.p1 TRINITY_DN10123_c0_g1~~TRINITY_DN10123_c0_g1_i1.p1  ORF type:complete len:139 (-),score=19.30 TRINITY_DN10123_c0_g1_i1:60-476(-)
MFGSIIRGYLRQPSWDAAKRFIDRRGRTPKSRPKKWYKGRGSRRLGRHTSKGRYIIDSTFVPELVVPELAGFALKPYVSYGTPNVRVPPPSLPDLTLSSIEPGVNLDMTLYPKRTKKEWELFAKREEEENKIKKQQNH